MLMKSVCFKHFQIYKIIFLEFTHKFIQQQEEKTKSIEVKYKPGCHAVQFLCSGLKCMEILTPALQTRLYLEVGSLQTEKDDSTAEEDVPS